MILRWLPISSRDSLFGTTIGGTKNPIATPICNATTFKIMKLSHCTPRLRLYLTIYRTIIWFAEIYFCDTKKIYLENDNKNLYKRDIWGQDRGDNNRDKALANVPKIFSHLNKSWFTVSKKNRQKVNTFSLPIIGFDNESEIDSLPM